MAKLEGRLGKREEKAGIGVHWYPVHRIIQHVGQTQDEAIDAFGRDRIGPNDNLTIRRIVDPRPDDDGRVIPQQNGAQHGQA